ncbi:hypothetical protein AU255_05735 [Methyloprofundus sedimenti]|uniref:Uncharacterized protein n=1 Tax=Methyloprofundus sedimenti TaxID=1420851 RepID=A0A1V8M726_9GAMM|nr:hypothetical protein [Methyloprofundus sedimenti]OQK17380.1 hypothetical protein AU255_05735 [Methyloprofundus sedimenti]
MTKETTAFFNNFFDQAHDEVLVREPGKRKFSPAIKVSRLAGTLWEYAVQCENVYIRDWKAESDNEPLDEDRVLRIPQASPEAFQTACNAKERVLLPLPSTWTMWDDFPSQELIIKARDKGLYVEVWEKNTDPKIISVVFRGTEFKSLRDWITNLRWFLLFVPWHRDQYTLVAEEVGKELATALVKRQLHDREIKLFACGHSLGGGLAQHLAYSFPAMDEQGKFIPRLSHVYAFNPSPVTGWFSVQDKKQRDLNAADLTIDRIFEHGEVLAYARLALSYVNPPSEKNPAIRELRFNFLKSGNIIKSHTMRLMACRLIEHM